MYMRPPLLQIFHRHADITRSYTQKGKGLSRGTKNISVPEVARVERGMITCNQRTLPVRFQHRGLRGGTRKPQGWGVSWQK